MTRWKRDCVERFGAPDACRIFYEREPTLRGRGFAVLDLVARTRRNGLTVGLGPAKTLLRIARAYIAAVPT